MLYVAIMADSSSTRKQSSHQDVVKLLMKYVKEEQKTVPDKDGVDRNKTYLVYECMHLNCKNPDRRVNFQKNSGFTNPFNNLKTCVADSKLEELYKLYDENKAAAQSKGNLDVYGFTPVSRITHGG